MLRILFQPFDFVKWLVLGFSAWLANLGNGAGGSGRVPAGDLDELDGSAEALHDLGRSFESFLDHALIVPLISVVILAVVALVLLLLWLSSRGKFIFLDNLVHDRAAIVEPWKRFARLGNSLFLWRVGFGLAVIVGFGFMLLLLLGPAIGLAGGRGGIEELSLAVLLLIGLLLAVGGVLVAYVALFLESFVIPIMYRYDLKATAAWRAFLPWLSSRGGWFLLYGLFVVLLFVLFSVVFLVVCVMTCCVLLIPYVGTVLLLPAIVTYRLLSVEFLAQFDPGFDLFAATAEAPVEAPAEA